MHSGTEPHKWAACATERQKTPQTQTYHHHHHSYLRPVPPPAVFAVRPLAAVTAVVPSQDPPAAAASAACAVHAVLSAALGAPQVAQHVPLLPSHATQHPCEPAEPHNTQHTHMVDLMVWFFQRGNACMQEGCESRQHIHAHALVCMCSLFVCIKHTLCCHCSAATLS